MADVQFTIYASWTKNDNTEITEISAFGGVSSDEDDEPNDLFGDDHGSVEGHICIQGDSFIEAFGRLPVLYVRSDGTTTNVDEHDDCYTIFFKCIEDLCNKTFELRFFFDIIE
ncbi:hypothetical protein A1F96_10648 [Pyrenophora tritici-repentis]|uniref:Protamine-P1 domain containing protein n=2 Tax=Pyrenophora tritici-repentis TaxID=45151 RepID=A0A2W1GST6_9PLEO|nr:uncharacterized protein PTRG_09264 [Pyrenophora tritici-repentis Pt-1C-BFP]KAF7441816.1 hypothetical protein A1F99_136680 [Pyrenophora tritici-repentis]EDU42315.1 predicted protein [Pyrenophora tritici-repentis Pt-1C-BFP]KAF7567815.1 Protamine-P1 domain containing protein [Pyrenophora tritici-repentis]KAI0570077.1 hypothetical protein Alg215_11278 [Pyrenophora tritici-repentis]KAI1507922.1 hypothetical protein Ptr86124_013176 [Pyrenophora tritici-repentis]